MDENHFSNIFSQFLDCLEYLCFIFKKSKKWLIEVEIRKKT